MHFHHHLWIKFFSICIQCCVIAINVTESETSRCTNKAFQCDNVTCINNSLRCDGSADCLDGSDEENCDVCAGSSLKCSHRRCIAVNKTCDGVVDCVSPNDEENCQDMITVYILGIGISCILILVITGAAVIINECKKKEGICKSSTCSILLLEYLDRNVPETTSEKLLMKNENRESSISTEIYLEEDNESINLNDVPNQTEDVQAYNILVTKHQLQDNEYISPLDELSDTEDDHAHGVFQLDKSHKTQE